MVCATPTIHAVTGRKVSKRFRAVESQAAYKSSALCFPLFRVTWYAHDFSICGIQPNAKSRLHARTLNRVDAYAAQAPRASCLGKFKSFANGARGDLLLS